MSGAKGRGLKMNDEMKKPQSGAQRPPDDEEAEIDLRIERPRSEPFDREARVFDRGAQKRFGGIDTAPAVFDRGVLFRTGKGRPDER
ncbi:MAG: hypothetical protein LBS91_02320 [Clostridiales Family XIII bacterium]|nr:hypothetical protein [Clostridiales Family XIII bacterium]